MKFQPRFAIHSVRPSSTVNPSESTDNWLCAQHHKMDSANNSDELGIKFLFDQSIEVAAATRPANFGDLFADILKKF